LISSEAYYWTTIWLGVDVSKAHHFDSSCTF
jgi:hypothetical protein